MIQTTLRRALPFGVALVLTGSLCAAEPPRSPFASPTRQFFAVSVPDVEAAADWYARVFGMEVEKSIDTEDGSVAIRILAAEHLTVEILQHGDARPLSALKPDVEKSYLLHGIFKVGLQVSDFDGALARLRATGVELVGEPIDDLEGGVRFVLFRDVAGNLLQLFGELAEGGP